ncbi:MAG: DNA polymerase III subunit gamma/tau, partial [Xanthobacteraceae bacterium]
ADNTAPVRALASFEELVELATEKRDLTMKSALERDVRLVRFEDGKLEIALEPGATQMMAGELSKKLNAWTGRRWMVVISGEPGAPTLRAQAEAHKAELKDGVRADPLVAAVLAKFPGAEIVAVRPPAGAAATNPDELPLNGEGDGDVADDQ